MTLENGGRAGGGGGAGQQCQPRKEEIFGGSAALWRGAAAAGWAYALWRSGARTTGGGLGCVSAAFQNVVISQGLLCAGGLGATERRGPFPKNESSVRVNRCQQGQGARPSTLAKGTGLALRLLRLCGLRARAGGGYSLPVKPPCSARGRALTNNVVVVILLMMRRRRRTVVGRP